jgi:hypothetical protein
MIKEEEKQEGAHSKKACDKPTPVTYSFLSSINARAISN